MIYKILLFSWSLKKKKKMFQVLTFQFYLIFKVIEPYLLSTIFGAIKVYNSYFFDISVES